ncbi:unnamed protein product [Mytilus coruscus]|uniref:Uncharacterized protein n=1 Tax=Mytilus coruscus TaxID=42192 RepID=A0A6J8AP24_MYTCO|nr:unnamed protein product [Mytilus coruscus]
MHRMKNNVCDKVVKFAENETKQVVENFRRRNQTLGLNDNSPVKLQTVGTYLSIYIKSRYKTRQNASQAIGIAKSNARHIFDPLWSVNKVADAIHMGQIQFREVLRTKFSVVSIDKTKVLVFRNAGVVNDYERWFYNNESLETVDEFCYLGFNLKYNGKFLFSQKELAEKGRKSMYAMLSTSRNQYLNTQTLLSLFDVYVGSVISYA